MRYGSTIAVAQGAGRGMGSRAWRSLLEKPLSEQADRRIFFQVESLSGRPLQSLPGKVDKQIHIVYANVLWWWKGVFHDKGRP